MKIQYFADTDTLLLTFNEQAVAETRDLDEATVLDFDAQGQVVALTLEQARDRVDVDSVTYQQLGQAPVEST
jgi:uncharacterized protein YuzE